MRRNKSFGDVFVVAITGSIGSGKSSACSYLKSLGISVIDADVIAKRLLEKGREEYLEIISLFGKEILDENQNIDKKRVAAVIFSDAGKMEKYKALLLSGIENEIRKEINLLSAEEREPYIVLEASALYEYGAEYLADFVVLIYADEELIISRVMRRNGFKREDVESRMRAQLPNEIKLKKCDYAIENSSDLDSFADKLMNLHNNLLDAVNAR